MSTVGLTKAMRRAIETPYLVDAPMRRKAHDAGFRVIGGDITPRGHAALAAPRMTQGQLDVLISLERHGAIYTYMRNSFDACCRKQWVDERGENLSDAGRTALNNVRAAMGSPDWKEGL